MQDFSAAQAQLNKARTSRAAAATSAAQAAAQQRALTQQITQLSRTLNSADRNAVGQMANLQAQLTQATADAQTKQTALQNAKQVVTAAQEGFASFTDPTKNLGLLSGQDPILLFPVRLETRFMNAVDRSQMQL